MFQNKESGPKIIVMAMAVLFGFLLLIFLYYLWAERFGGKEAITRPDAINPKDITTIVKAQNQNKQAGGFDKDDMFAEPNVPIAMNPSTNEVQPDPSDPDYVPDGFRKKIGYKPKKQVFSIDNNIFTYKEAEAACKAVGADLATYMQLYRGWKKGADWCSKGWIKGQAAVFPTQKKTWQKLQEDPDTKDNCGDIGINGGYEENTDQQFGVVCYGVKPPPRAHEKQRYERKSKKDYELERQIAKIKKNLPNLSINPFSDDKWSNCNNQ